MHIIYQLDHRHTTQLHRLYLHEWWTKTRTHKETETVVKNSSLVIGIVDDNDNLLAFARVLSDYLFKAMIFDVIVKESARAQGLGRRLLQLIETHEKLQNVKDFELYCHPDMESYYQKEGYQTIGKEVSLMRKQKEQQ